MMDKVEADEQAAKDKEFEESLNFWHDHAALYWKTENLEDYAMTLPDHHFRFAQTGNKSNESDSESDSDSD